MHKLILPCFNRENTTWDVAEFERYTTQATVQSDTMHTRKNIKLITGRKHPSVVYMSCIRKKNCNPATIFVRSCIRCLNRQRSGSSHLRQLSYEQVVLQEHHLLADSATPSCDPFSEAIFAFLCWPNSQPSHTASRRATPPSRCKTGRIGRIAISGHTGSK